MEFIISHSNFDRMALRTTFCLQSSITEVFVFLFLFLVRGCLLYHMLNPHVLSFQAPNRSFDGCPCFLAGQVLQWSWFGEQAGLWTYGARGVEL